MTPARLLTCLLSLVVAVPVLPAQTAHKSDAPAAHTAHTRRETAHSKEAAILPSYSAYNDHPKLAIILVIDQFRGDYLDRWRADFKNLSLIHI